MSLCISGLSLEGRKVAVFGCDDQYGYGDYFCDATEELHHVSHVHVKSDWRLAADL